MKVFIVLSALVVVASAGGYGNNGMSYANGINAMSSGASTQFRQDDHYGNYNFGYDESHSTGGSSRREEETNGVRRGSYSLTDADGRRRTVNYVADAAGFRATVDTNEPGTEAKSPADVIMNGAEPASVASVQYGSANAGYGAVQASYSAPAPIMNTYSQAARYTAVAAPVAQMTYSAPAPVMRSYSAPAQIVNTYSAPAPIVRAATYSAPAPIMRSYSAPAQIATINTGYAGEQQIEAPAPRAFSYSFSSAHPSTVNTGYGQQASYSVAAPVMNTYSAQAAPIMNTYSAPAPIMRAATYSAPAPIMNTYSAAPAPIIRATTYSAPAPIATISTGYNGNAAGYVGEQQIEAPAPRAFSYSFSSAHQAPVSSGYTMAAPIAAGISSYSSTGPARVGY